jgi:hypothetical protein
MRKSPCIFTERLTRALPVAACFAVLLFATSCGTVRRVIGDEEILLPNGPIAVTLTPDGTLNAADAGSAGVTGDKVLFSANVGAKNGVDVSYDWNFGTGATPSRSSLPKPSVVLNDSSVDPYHGTLAVATLRAGHEIERTYTFDYRVLPAWSKIIGDVYPKVLVAGRTQKLSVCVSIPTQYTAQYLWDLDSLDISYNPTDAAPELAIPSDADPGPYAGSVSVWPTGHEADGASLPFSLKIKAPPTSGFEILDEASPVYPSAVAAGSTQEFRLAVVVAGGAPLNYLWDFGALGPVDDPASAKPKITIDAKLPQGPYDGHVLVWLDSDASTQQDVPFTITVYPKPT